MLLELPTSAPIIPYGITNRDDPVELARLMMKPPLLLRALGGFFPGLASHHLRQVRRVLDIGCGPGGWSLALARSYPKMEVIGIDTSPMMIRHAERLVVQQGMRNVHYYQRASLSEPLPFADGAFDLINAPFLGTQLSTADWLYLLAECHRLLRSGGKLRLTEGEIGRSNVCAHEHLALLWKSALQRAGYLFGHEERHSGLLATLQALLATAGLEEHSSLVQVIDYSYGADLHEAWIQDLLILMKGIQPFLLAMRVASQEHLDGLYAQLQREVRLPFFQAVQPIVTLWATIGHST